MKIFKIIKGSFLNPIRTGSSESVQVWQGEVFFTPHVYSFVFKPRKLKLCMQLKSFSEKQLKAIKSNKKQKQKQKHRAGKTKTGKKPNPVTKGTKSPNGNQA